MRKGTSILGVTVIGLAMASACSDDSSTDLDEKTTAGGAHVVRATSGALTPPSTAAPSAIAKHFVADRTGVADQQLVIAAEIPGRNGVTHVRLTQLVDGLRVAGAYAKVAISDRGEVIQSIDKLAAVAGAPIAARIDEHAALAAAISALGYRAAMTYHQAPTVERVAYLADDGLHVGFEVMTWTETGNRLNYTVVGGDGSIVSVEDRTQHDAYNVYAEDPLKGGQAVVNGPGGNGWLGAGSQSTTNITGNNAHAYLDRDANNAPDTGGTAVADGNFLTAANLGAAPTTAGNQSVAVQNLFYFNNTIHDILYSHGFNEAAGNFQTNNFGNGGAGNDAVNAEAQDGSGTDNANFSTPADGSAPRMQMYLWTGSAPDAFVSVNGTDYGAFGSAFGPAVTTAGVAGPLAVYRDASGDTNDACEASTTSLTGKVAIVNRGTCNFTVKVLNAQNAGAIAVVIANNAPGPASTPGGTERKIKIPSGEVTQADGATLKTLAGASGRLRKSNLVALQIDGDIDADIVFHEYGHGLSWRMIGGMSGPLAGAIGEGASDVNAFLVNGDDRIGEYAFSNPIGVRRAPYQDYALTYSSVTGAEVHNDGEIYAAAMWKVFQNYLAAGLTASDLQDDFVDGMNFTPATPADEDMRDGMLQGLPAGSPRACLIWRGFAAQGIGVGADGRLGHHNAVIITESFAVPAGC